MVIGQKPSEYAGWSGMSAVLDEHDRADIWPPFAPQAYVIHKIILNHPA